MNKALFYTNFRKHFGKLNQTQVDVIECVLDSGWDNAQRAYVIATSWHESKLEPVREGFFETDEASRAYVKRRRYKYAKVINGHVYYGRGLIQLTWEENYARIGKLFGIDLVNNPDLALEPELASKILIEWFRTTKAKGKTFFEVVNDESYDFVFARRFVNIQDKARLIAGYATLILKMIQDANSDTDSV